MPPRTEPTATGPTPEALRFSPSQPNGPEPARHSEAIPAEAKSQRQAMIDAAAAYDNLNRTIVELRGKLQTATLGIEARNVQIDQLELQLASERNRAATFQSERDDALAERNAVVTLFHNFKSQLERFTVKLPALPSVRLPGGDPQVHQAVIDGQKTNMSDEKDK
jgi:hypothetical protein